MDKITSQLAEFFSLYSNWLVLTGAGISADSGIPTYRDNSGTWLRNRPIQHQEFVQQRESRQRYWGRSMIGWPNVRDARCNANHSALVDFERSGRSTLVITQNVDRLHQAAGSQNVIDLHGRLDRVVCLDCGAGYERDRVQQELEKLNPQHRGFEAMARPDGDADLSAEQVRDVNIWDCEVCGGMLKPDVVFFGGTIPRERVTRCQEALTAADGLLVIGSSLQVFSGFRFCRQAVEQRKPLVILNEGTTRADEMATLKINAHALSLFREVTSSLAPRMQSRPPQGINHG
ncbi:MAG: NAD-dependent protein deacetylase [Halieaceae bacterium]|jgi:NAD-dependent SIR2 family protein deacetylase|nr:NAD-dependent protein deacetylase [Halieaceae bacterium]MBT6334194.1 NAD-dependent protein deacetylase [Halieaceae bacterium]MBT7340029.1 NAD-dependent protein deacetylase [Halieaceae bacterium]